MKTKWIIIPVIALSLGCTRELDTNVTYIDGEFTLYASSGEKETRTVLQQDGRVFWSPSDCITVFYGNIPGKFTSTNTEPAASAEFTGSLGLFVLDGETEFKAIYPHSDDIVMPSDNGVLSINLPSEQTAVEGTFADDLFICVAKSKDVNLHFYNVCGGVKFSLAREDIKKVVFKGNKGESLAGRMAVGFGSDGIPQVTDMTGGKSSVTLVVPDGGTFKSGSWYYLVLAPQTLTKGFTIELWADGLVETVSSESSVSVRRATWGVLKNLGCGYRASDVPDAIDLGLPSGIKWASFNLGASTPEEDGDYFAWGEIEPYYSSLEPLTWKPGKEDGYRVSSYRWWNGDYKKLTKYCPANMSNLWDGKGTPDDKTILDTADDVASVNFGGKWRIPTDEEWTELRKMCTWSSATQNGVDGYLVTGPNGNSVFLPNVFCYWSSSLSTDNPSCAWSLILGPEVHRYASVRCDGQYIRPVYGNRYISVKSISLDKTSVYLDVGETVSLSATILPDDASDKSVTWSSSDESVARVSSSGVVTGYSLGYAIITATSDGGATASCGVTVKESSSTPDAVDLGLSVKWASFNLGASRPEEYGDYYAWGEVEPYYMPGYALSDEPVWKSGKEDGYNWSSYKWCNEVFYALTKYCSSYGENGFTDGKTVLEKEDDAAFVRLGGKWRMPTDEEWMELFDNCIWTRATQNGVAGRLATSSNGNSIFFPAAGYRFITDLIGVNYDGCFWSSSLDGFNSLHAYCYSLGNCARNWEDRRLGYSIRPVYAE